MPVAAAPMVGPTPQHGLDQLGSTCQPKKAVIFERCLRGTLPMEKFGDQSEKVWEHPHFMHSTEKNDLLDAAIMQPYHQNIGL